MACWEVHTSCQMMRRQSLEASACAITSAWSAQAPTSAASSCSGCRQPFQNIFENWISFGMVFESNLDNDDILYNRWLKKWFFSLFFTFKYPHSQLFHTPRIFKSFPLSEILSFSSPLFWVFLREKSLRGPKNSERIPIEFPRGIQENPETFRISATDPSLNPWRSRWSLSSRKDVQAYSRRATIIYAPLKDH